MQNYKYDKAIVPESKNGGSPALNNNPRKGGSKRALLICLDLFCLFMGEPTPLSLAPGPCPAAPRRSAPVPARRGARARGSALPRWRGAAGRPLLRAPPRCQPREAPAASPGSFAPLLAPGPRPTPSHRPPGLRMNVWAGAGFRGQL